MDDIEQSHRVLGLVRLKLADEVQLGCRVGFPQCGPLALRFLNAVLSEMALPLHKQWFDRLGRMGLADRNKRNIAGFAAGDCASLGNIRLYLP